MEELMPKWLIGIIAVGLVSIVLFTEFWPKPEDQKVVEDLKNEEVLNELDEAVTSVCLGEVSTACVESKERARVAKKVLTSHKLSPHQQEMVRIAIKKEVEHLKNKK